MRIRSKIILVVLPLIITPLVLLGIASFYAARNGITGVATEFLAFKAEQLASYADSQWNVLEQNGLSSRPEFVDLAKAAVASFARSMVRSPTEVILALEADGTPAFLTSDAPPKADETDGLAALAREEAGGWREVRLDGKALVAQTVKNASFGWTIAVMEERAAFYRATEVIAEQSAWILGAAALLAIVFLLLFSGFLTRPLRLVVKAMRGVTGSTDLSQRVKLLSRDETGELAHTFNLMTGELEQAYGQIKSYALDSAVAHSREQKVRNIFQKYVPKEVIDEWINSPESMLKGESRKLAVLFSDIRDFTHITEPMKPEELVESLNAYFEGMVDVIVSRRGVVDKYMGDCIMAFFGAPVHHQNDAWQSVQAAFDMLDYPDAVQRAAAGERENPLPHRHRHHLRPGHHRQHRVREEDGLHGDRQAREPGQPAREAHQVLQGAHPDHGCGAARGGRPGPGPAARSHRGQGHVEGHRGVDDPARPVGGRTRSLGPARQGHPALLRARVRQGGVVLLGGPDPAARRRTVAHLPRAVPGVLPRLPRRPIGAESSSSPKG